MSSGKSALCPDLLEAGITQVACYFPDTWCLCFLTTSLWVKSNLGEAAGTEDQLD